MQRNQDLIELLNTMVVEISSSDFKKFKSELENYSDDLTLKQIISMVDTIDKKVFTEKYSVDNARLVKQKENAIKKLITKIEGVKVPPEAIVESPEVESSPEAKVPEAKSNVKTINTKKNTTMFIQNTVTAGLTKTRITDNGFKKLNKGQVYGFLINGEVEKNATLITASDVRPYVKVLGTFENNGDLYVMVLAITNLFKVTDNMSLFIVED